MNEPAFHPVSATQTFATVVLPLAVPKPYTYVVPEPLLPAIGFGKRVEVQFGKNKRYTALVVRVHQEAPEYRPKELLSVIDDSPIITAQQWRLWQWLADYYVCTLGEVMNAALPANLKLSSETMLTLSPLFDRDYVDLDDKEYLIAEALSIQEEISIADVRNILDQKTVYPLIRSMLEKRIIYLREELREKFKPKKVVCLRLAEPYRSDRKLLDEAFEKLGRSDRQVEALMAYLQLARGDEHVRRQDVYKKARVDGTVIKAMVKKKVLEAYEKETTRLAKYEEEIEGAKTLSEQQEVALQRIAQIALEKRVTLLHGVTGSGKTRIYIELMQAALRRGEQVLYLLPEIALTAQIVSRLQRVFGDDITLYHSRLNNNERVEVWNEVLQGKSIVLGPRSALFLPFQKLKLIVVDEEHDPSYKQYDPNPRYHGRDTAIYLAGIHNAQVILGTATPSIESYHNAKSGKYGLVEMKERYGGLKLPSIDVVSAKVLVQSRDKSDHFTPQLLEALQATLELGEQAILFQNRRGYAPVYRCLTCDWHSECIHCDVSLTYHKFHRNLKCHYCGYTAQLPRACPACGSNQLTLFGFGTEKIEDELKIYLPEAKIQRMDFDTVRGKNAHGKIIGDFESGKIDILVGTQMVTKGLDFDKVGLVGILSSDQLLQYPDFRASERAFQLMLQVSGRAGRKHKQGKVLIQALNTEHPVLREVKDNDYFGFFQREMQERHAFSYPPLQRLIKVTLKHKKPAILNDGARLCEKNLKAQLGEWVKGPAVPHVGRVRSYYLMDFLIKLPKDAAKIKYAKQALLHAADEIQRTRGLSGVRISVDVDPY